MDMLDIIIHQLDNILKDQERIKEKISDITLKIDKQGTIITAIEEKINQ